MGVADPLATANAAIGGPGPRPARSGRPQHLVVGAFGGLTPEKRLPQVLEAVAALAAAHPQLHLLMVGTPALHYDVADDAAVQGLADRVHFTGFVPDAELPAHLQAADICCCLRWPTNGETSASWLRAVAAGRPTIITDLAHQPEVPVIDPRGWRSTGAGSRWPWPCRSSKRAPRWWRRIGRTGAQSRPAGTTRPARAPLLARPSHAGAHGRRLPAVITRGQARPAPRPALPAHLRGSGGERLATLLAPFGVETPAGVAE